MDYTPTEILARYGDRMPAGQKAHIEQKARAMLAGLDRMYPALAQVRDTGKAYLLGRPGSTKQMWLPRSAVSFVSNTYTSDVREDGNGLQVGEHKRIRFPIYRWLIADWARAKLVAAGVLDK